MSETTPNPFECARRRSGINVLLKPEDVMDVSERIDWAQAERVLDEHGAMIAAQMIATGKEVAAQIIREQGGRT